MPRRSMLAGILVGLAAPAHAGWFESPAQKALASIAAAQPKLQSLVEEVAEVSRRRIKMANDPEDDAYVFRFARSVLDPAAATMSEVAPGLTLSGPTTEQTLGDGEPQVTALALSVEFKAHLNSLYAACRAQSTADQLTALRAAERTMSDFLQLARSAKYDVTPKETINSYSGATEILYNKFLFRAS